MQECVDAGLVAEREEGGAYDRFRNRLLFPIRDHKGAVVGFGGRALGDGQTPKYLNSPQSAVFDKSQILYGLDLARPNIQRNGQVVIVEGYMDVVVAHQAGQTNVVGTIGTALTDHHAELLKRIAKKVILCLDPDTAGDMAALKGSEVLQSTPRRSSSRCAASRELIGELERRFAAEIRIMQLTRGRTRRLGCWRKAAPLVGRSCSESALPGDTVIGVVAGKQTSKTPTGKSEAGRDAQ